jgi:predicted XRE-type DNA-binding protein
MKNKSWPVTKAVKDRILHLAETTDMHEHEIAVSVGVNHGRVSEVLNGLR